MITPEAMSPAQEAWFDYRKDYGSWHEPELSQAHKHFVAGFEFAQSEGLPFIATQAKAEALRYEANALDKLAAIQDHWRGADYLDGVNAARTEAADWLRARAATIESEASK